MPPQFNLKNNLSPEENYQNGLLPQRNKKGLYYHQSSCRSNLKNFHLTSENRRIIKKTQNFSFKQIPLDKFQYTPLIQKTISSWTKQLNWNFPTSSIKYVFSQHIFNQLYIWQNQNKQIVAYNICYFSPTISHGAYVFYSPKLKHSNLPIRMVLQVTIDSQKLGLKYCYMGRFSTNNGYYKRNVPGFQHFINHSWQSLKN